MDGVNVIALGEVHQAWLALVGVLFGGIGVKLLDYRLAKSGSKVELQTQIRAELREDIVSLRELVSALRLEVAEIESKLDDARRRYYNLLVAFNEVVALAVVKGFVDEIDEIREKLDERNA